MKHILSILLLLSFAAQAQITKLGTAATTPPSFTLTDGAGREGTDTYVSFAITKTGQRTNDSSYVLFTVSGDVATKGVDFADTTILVGFHKNDFYRVVYVRIIDDAVEEDAEGFGVNIAVVSNARLTRGNAIGYILDNDESVPEPDPDPEPTQPYTSFTLTDSATISIGVYDGNKLIRTLFNNQRYPAGTHAVEWDGRNDAGVYDSLNKTIRVLKNNVNYTWEGVVGNTSDFFTGRTVVRSFETVTALAIVLGKIYLAPNYVEGQPEGIYLNTSNPQQKFDVTPYGSTSNVSHVATDGQRVYWAVSDNYGTGRQHVYATAVSNNAFITFPGGTSRTVTHSRTYSSAIDTLTNKLGTQSGMAVQTTGSYLLVSHKSLNKIHVLNKTSGALVQNVTFTAPEEIAIDATGYLWVVSGTGVTRHTINTDGTISAASLTLSSLVAPQALGTKQDTVLVIDGGSSQQVKAFKNTSTTAAWTLGIAGGYNNSPLVENNKFAFSTVRGREPADIAADPVTGHFWIIDGGNRRIQHFGAGRQFIETVQYLRRSRSATVDPGNPNRVFSDLLEFEIDYTKPLAPNNGSWVFKRNWGYNMPSNLEGQNYNLNRATTLSNGRTYATPHNGSTGRFHLVELTASGLRFIGDLPQGLQLFDDGSLRGWTGGFNGTLSFIMRPLTGFDGSGNPTWGTQVTVAQTTQTDTLQPVMGHTATSFHRPFYITDSGYVVSFNTHGNYLGSKGYHLGGIKQGSREWAWRTAMSTRTDHYGQFPTDGWFDRGNHAQYWGNTVRAWGRNVLWGYHGEFWKGNSSPGQTNKYNHFYDNGLMVGQFGTTTWDGDGGNQSSEFYYAGAEMAGNAYSWHVANFGDSAYLYHCDESWHSGVHRWKITGLNTITEQILPAKVYTAAKDYVDILEGLPNNSVISTGGRVTRTPAEQLQWSVRTGVKAYDRTDLYAKFRGTLIGIPATVKVAFPVVVNTPVWSLDMNITFDESYPNPGPFPLNSGGAMEVLDGAGKVIARVNSQISYATRPYVVSVMGNNRPILAGSNIRREVLDKVQHLKIERSGANITFTYAGQTLTTPMADGTAAGDAPAAVQLRFWAASGSTVFTHVIDIRDVHLRYTAN